MSTSTVLDGILSGLQTAQALATASPIPGLGIAVTVAVSLLRTLQNARHLTSECKLLGQHAAQLTLGMYLQLNSAEYHPVDQQIILIIDEHAMTLQEIESYMIKITRRSFILRMVLSGKMREDLETYRGKLDAASRLFGTRALVHVMNRVSELTNTRSGNGGHSSITSSCKGIVSKTPPPCLPPPTDIVPGPPPGQASPIMSSLSPQDLPWLPPYVPQATPHPPSPEGNPRVPLTPQKGVLRKPNRIKSNQEIRTSKPPSRKLSRENVSRRRKSNHDLSAFAKDVATMVESDVVALEGIVRRTTTEQVKGIHEAHTRIVNETLTSMHHSMSRSEIKTTHTRRFNSRNENGSTGLFDIPELRMSF